MTRQRARVAATLLAGLLLLPPGVAGAGAAQEPATESAPAAREGLGRGRNVRRGLPSGSPDVMTVQQV